MILLVSVSARMLAELATREGHAVVAVDRFGDADLQRLCPSVSIMRDLGGRGGMAELVAAAEPIRADRVIYGAGLENRPDLVARLAAGRTLLGCTPRTLRRVRDPVLLGAALRAADFAYPRTLPGRDAPERADRTRRWLRKPVRGGGGRGVRPWRGERPVGDVIVQERIAGLPCSAAAVADGRSATLLGVSEQLIGRRALGAGGLRWCGNVVPPRLPAREQDALAAAAQAICAHLAAAFGLRGVFGVDMVWDGAQPWVVEVNPRPVASLETIDAVHGARSFAAHLAGCAGRLPEAGGGGVAAAAGKAVVFAAEDLRVPDTSGWTARGIRDVPHPGSGSRPAARSARSSRPAARPRPCSPTWRRAPRRCAASSARWASMPSHDRAATCAGCGLVCDDITAVVGADGGLERLVGTCPLGDAWFGARVAPAPPIARIAGREAGLEDAVEAATAILARARVPLVYGLGQASCEAQRAAVALADAVGAVIDPAGPLLDGASGLAFQARGASTATLGDVRDRADVVVIWRADPVRTHPRLLERLRLPGAARTLVVVDERRTATAGQADTFLELPASRDAEALWTLRALVGEAPVAAEPALADLAEGLRGARSVAILHHLRGQVEALGLYALVRDLCSVTHAVTVTLRHEGNAAGAEDVLAWQTGYPSAVSFAAGHPRSNPGELSAAAVLARGDADAALVVGSDPLAHLPPEAAERLRAIPVVTVDACDTATAAAARVAFTTAAAGVHRPGVVHRLDGVPVPLRAPLASARPSDAEVLGAIAGRVARAQEAPA